MKLCRLTYFSRALVDTSDTAAIDRLAANSGARNALFALTGVLAASNDAFLQVLEGPRAPLCNLLNRLEADPRHESVIVAEFRDIQARVFPAWAMTVAIPETPETTFSYRSLFDKSGPQLLGVFYGRLVAPVIGEFRPIDTTGDTVFV